VCLATVYLEDDGQREEAMRDVAWIVPESGGLELISFFGESGLFWAQIRSIDLVNGSVVLVRMAAEAARVEFDGQRNG
jgi:predicted RNA-binding protein